MSDFKIKIAVGLGDAIFISSALEKSNFDNIYVGVRWDIMKTYRDESYYNFYKDLVNIVFSDPKFIVNINENNYPYLTMVDLWQNGINPILPNYASKLCKPSNNIIEGSYIVLTTKVRQLPKEKFNGIRKDFYIEINKLAKRYKIVVIGEREVEMNAEYQHYGGNNIYCIYKDFVKNIKEFTDFTVPALGLTPPDINKLMEDCDIMNKAKSVISFGCGGNLILSLSVGKNIICYRKDDYKFLDHIVSGHSHIYAKNSCSDFINALKQL